MASQATWLEGNIAFREDQGTEGSLHVTQDLKEKREPTKPFSAALKGNKRQACHRCYSVMRCSHPRYGSLLMHQHTASPGPAATAKSTHCRFQRSSQWRGDHNLHNQFASKKLTGSSATGPKRGEQAVRHSTGGALEGGLTHNSLSSPSFCLKVCMLMGRQATKSRAGTVILFSFAVMESERKASSFQQHNNALPAPSP